MPGESGLQQIINVAKKRYRHLDPRGIGPHSTPYPRNQHCFDTSTGRFQIGTALAYLAENKSERRSTHAYGLKRRAESWGRKNGFAPYVSAGAMIVAMHHFKMKVR